MLSESKTQSAKNKEMKRKAKYSKPQQMLVTAVKVLKRKRRIALAPMTLMVTVILTKISVEISIDTMVRIVPK